MCLQEQECNRLSAVFPFDSWTILLHCTWKLIWKRPSFLTSVDFHFLFIILQPLTCFCVYFLPLSLIVRYSLHGSLLPRGCLILLRPCSAPHNEANSDSRVADIQATCCICFQRQASGWEPVTSQDVLTMTGCRCPKLGGRESNFKEHLVSWYTSPFKTCPNWSHRDRGCKVWWSLCLVRGKVQMKYYLVYLYYRYSHASLRFRYYHCKYCNGTPPVPVPCPDPGSGPSPSSGSDSGTGSGSGSV